MIKNIIALLSLGILLSCGTAPAFAKGNNGGGRSYSRPAYSRNVTVNKTVIVHHDNSGGSGSGLLTGMIVGHMLSQPVVVQQPPVVVQPVPQVVAQPQIVEQPQQVKEEKQDNMLTELLAFAAIVGLAGFILVLHKSNKHA